MDKKIEDEEGSAQWLRDMVVALTESQAALTQHGLTEASTHVALAINALKDL